MEPDDRATHRGGPKSGQRPDRGPAAAGQQGPYDHKDPPERDRSQPDSSEPEKPKTGDEQRRDEPVHRPSDIDARGEDKYRKVIGQHNPNRGRQLLYYGIFIAFIVKMFAGALRAGTLPCGGVAAALM
jgi:hypothetical protein